MEWQYDASKVEEFEFKKLPVGDHKLRVASIEEKESSTGKKMLEFEFDASGTGVKIRYWLVFNPDKEGITNGNIKNISDSFGIEPGNFNFDAWLGKIGAAHIKHQDKYANISYFIPKCKQESLGNWIESSKTPF